MFLVKNLNIYITLSKCTFKLSIAALFSLTGKSLDYKISLTPPLTVLQYYKKSGKVGDHVYVYQRYRFCLFFSDVFIIFVPVIFLFYFVLFLIDLHYYQIQLVSHLELINILNLLSSSDRQIEEGKHRIETEKDVCYLQN